MGVDEQRLKNLEDALSRLNTNVEQAIRTGSQADRSQVERDQRRLEDEFSEDELRMIRDHRAYDQHRRLMNMYLEEIEEEALDVASEEEPEEEAAEEDETEGGDEEPAAKPKKPAAAKKKPAAKKPAKPPGRHADPDGEDELPGGAPAARKRLAWLGSD